MKIRISPTQQKYLRLVERGQALLNEAEQLRMRVAKTCKHPTDFVKPMGWGVAVVGENCHFCKLVRYTGGEWGPRASMELIAKAACKHPSVFLVDYTWEHDNGYGRQSQVVGDRCSFCSAKRSWKGSSGWTTEEQQRRNRRERDDY